MNVNEAERLKDICVCVCARACMKVIKYLFTTITIRKPRLCKQCALPTLVDAAYSAVIKNAYDQVKSA